MEPIRAIIIDDEKNGRENLRNLLKKYCPNIQVVDEANSASTGLDAIIKHKPGLIFLDIEMPGGNGFTLLEKAVDVHFETIFVTAYNLYAIRAFKFSAVDYLLKPIKIPELKSAVERAVQRMVLTQPEHVKTLLQNMKADANRQKISLPQSNGSVFVFLHDIVRCQSDNNYTWFYMADGKKILVARTLKDYEELLSENGFYRVHQSHIVNIVHIKQYIKGENAFFVLSDESNIPVAQRKKNVVKDILARLPL